MFTAVFKDTGFYFSEQGSSLRLTFVPAVDVCLCGCGSLLRLRSVPVARVKVVKVSAVEVSEGQDLRISVNL